MMHPLLQRQLLSVFRRRRQIQMSLLLALYWGTLALLGACLILGWGSTRSLLWLLISLTLGLSGAALLLYRQRLQKPDYHALAQEIEIRHPELNGALITAVQQRPAPDGKLHYLQQRVVEQAVLHGRVHSWAGDVSRWRIAAAHFAHFVTVCLFVGALLALTFTGRKNSVIARIWTPDGVSVTPGDTSIERGERLVVVATFTGSVPANSDLVITSPADQPKRIPLVKSLSDPVYGGSIPEVTNDFIYHVEYSGKRTADFAVKVFELPRLERADADLIYPAYTGLAPKRIENTRRVTAVEGTKGKLALQLNKPVARAQLVSKDQPGVVLSLSVNSNAPVASLASLSFETTRTYSLQLVDAEGRTNKLPAQFVFDVLKNREPELKITSPRGDTRPSALEEISFAGTVWDDFGVQSYGLAYVQGGGEIKFVELGQATSANERRPFTHTLRLEDLGAKPDELISWFAWADDVGPDGNVRRTLGDMYFAEVRPFDELFRQGQGQGGGGEQSGGGGSEGGGSPQTKLTELQKQIINATWKLQRQQSRPASPAPKDKPKESTAIERPQGRQMAAASFGVVRNVFGQRASGNASGSSAARPRSSFSRDSGTNKTNSATQFADDLNVLRDAVAQGISQARAAQEQQSGGREAELWDSVIREMEKAGAALDKAAKSPSSLDEALAAEQAAFQALLKLQQREFQVSRNRSRSQQGGSSRDQQMQQQLDQLDLTNPENRYENERLAQAPQSAERREQLQVMNRLGELARRQQDVNERLKELQTALQAARTEQEREEIRRQLKRLEEEEQRMLADMDELQQRMNQPENQSRMSEERQQLEQARQEMQRSAESAQQGSTSQALASGTRAQRQLQEMRENMRKQNSSEFAEDLKQLRNEAREAELRQREIQKQMESSAGDGPKSLDDSKERQKSLEQLAQQAQRLTNLVERATQLSQQTEESEPLASRELYDTLRKFSQDDANSIREFQDQLIQSGLLRTDLYRRLGQLAKEDGAKAVELTSELLRQGLLPQAQQAGDKAASAVSDLKRGIERAAEKVLGDDTEALRLAQQQLEQLTRQVEREIEQGQGAGATNTLAQASGEGSQSSTDAIGHSGEAATGNQGGREARPGEGERATNTLAQADNGATQSSTDASGRGRETASTEQRRAETGNQNRSPRPGETGSSQGESQDSESAQTQPGQNGEGDGQSQPTDSAQNGRGNGEGREGRAQSGRNGNRGVPRGLEQFLDANARGGDGSRNGRGAVITGEDFGPWSDGLREIEEMVDDTTQQNQLATVRERARLMRQEYNRTRQEPDWGSIRSQVLKPLVEVRNQIADELARRGSRENLVPIDRDPVPARYSESVRRYYEELGKEK